MSHHDVLDAVENNISVILCNHSNSERGYLQSFKLKFSEILENKANIIVSTSDTDPLLIH